MLLYSYNLKQSHLFSILAIRQIIQVKNNIRRGDVYACALTSTVNFRAEKILLQNFVYLCGLNSSYDSVMKYDKMEEQQRMRKTIEYQNIHGNRKYKDSLFRLCFNNKKDLLDLYNAINRTDYDDPEELEINTLDNALYITVKNDVSCIIGCTMNLYEHQSTKNPNMPLRGLNYFAQMYNRYAEKQKLNLYSNRLQKIPTPQYVVFYNGLDAEPDRQILKLSDAFQTEGGCLECKVIMLNINYGHNQEIMEKCRRLEEYAVFVAIVRRYIEQEGVSLTEALGTAIDECIAKGVLADILVEQRAEVCMYILEAFDKEIYERDLKEEAIAKGLEEGRKEGIKAIIKKKLKKGNTPEQIADALEEEISVIKELIAELDDQL